MSVPLASTAVLLAEDRHLMPRCALHDRVRLATSDRGGASEQPWRPATDFELRQLTDANGAVSDVPAYALFSIPPRLQSRLAAAWQRREAAAPSGGSDDDLIADLVDFFDFIDAPVRGFCSVQMDRIDEQGMDAGSVPVAGGSSHLARINPGPAEAALFIGPVEQTRGSSVLIRVALAPGEGVFVPRGAMSARLNARPGEPTLVISVLPEK